MKTNLKKAVNVAIIFFALTPIVAASDGFVESISDMMSLVSKTIHDSLEIPTLKDKAHLPNNAPFPHVEPVRVLTKGAVMASSLVLPYCSLSDAALTITSIAIFAGYVMFETYAVTQEIVHIDFRVNKSKLGKFWETGKVCVTEKGDYLLARGSELTLLCASILTQNPLCIALSYGTVMGMIKWDRIQNFHDRIDAH